MTILQQLLVTDENNLEEQNNVCMSYSSVHFHLMVYHLLFPNLSTFISEIFQQKENKKEGGKKVPKISQDVG